MIVRNCVVLLVFVCAWARIAHGADGPPLNETLPHDTLAFIEISPAAEMAGKPNGAVDLGLRALAALGVAPAAGTASDVLGLGGELGANPSCVALLDADLAAGPKGELQCRSVQLVWIIKTDRPQEMVGRITGLLSHVSTQTTAKQEVQKTAEAGKEYVWFHDTRWPAWAELAWEYEAGEGKAPGTFTMAFGQGAMEHYLADRPVGDVPWKDFLAAADTEAEKKGVTHGGTLPARVYVSPRGFQQRFAEPMKRTSLGPLFSAWELNDIEHSVLTVRQNGRELAIFSAEPGRGGVAVTPWTVSLPPGAALLRALPEDATAYAVFNVQWTPLYQRAMAALDAAFIDPGDEPLETQAAALAQKAGVDLGADILERLEPYVLVHDSPRHPLGIPLMVTTLAAARPGGEAKVRSALARITDVVAQDIDAHGRPVRVRTDSDGVSYVQFGLVGPAWGWIDDALVTSWSPGALRMNRPAAGKVTSAAFAPDRP